MDMPIPEESPLDLLYFGLTALFWIGHRLCSTYLAYCTEAYRPLLRTQPVRFVVIPLLVTAGCFAVFLAPDAALPCTREERLVAFAIVDYVFVTYHFAAQHFGALSLYRARVGRAAHIRTRNMDRLFALGVGGVLVFLADILAGAVAYQDQWVDRWSLLPWFVSAQDGIRAGATLVLLFATAAMLLAELRAPRSSLPRVLYILGVATMVALALRPRSPFLFLVIWTSQHWILATGLASQMAVAEPAPVHGVVRRVFHSLNVRPWAVVFILVLSSVVLLPLFEVEGEPAGRYVLRRPDIRCRRDGIADVLVGSCLARFRVCDRLRPLPPRPKCLPTVRSPRARGGASPIGLRFRNRALVSVRQSAVGPQ